MGLNEGVVDGDNLDIGVLDSVAEDDTADTTETVDANLDGSHFEDCWENVSVESRKSDALVNWTVKQNNKCSCQAQGEWKP